MLPFPNGHISLDSHQAMLSSCYLMQTVLVRYVTFRFKQKILFLSWEDYHDTKQFSIGMNSWTLRRLLEKQWVLANEILHLINFESFEFLFFFPFQLLLSNFELGKQKFWVENVDCNIHCHLKVEYKNVLKLIVSWERFFFILRKKI